MSHSYLCVCVCYIIFHGLGFGCVWLSVRGLCQKVLEKGRTFLLNGGKFMEHTDAGNQGRRAGRRSAEFHSARAGGCGMPAGRSETPRSVAAARSLHGKLRAVKGGVQ